MDTLREILAACYDLGSQVVYFPVRHHSLACAMHLRRTMEAYRPEAILIEGPADTDHLIPHIGAPDNQAPVCIYYSYLLKGKGDEDDLRTAAYYPLLDFSPELCAIRYGVEQGVETGFIDLPYGVLSTLERERGATGEAGEKASYYDDYYLSRSRFIERLCEKQNCRHYGELWEKLFEIGGLPMETGDFVHAMLALCHYSRVEYPAELLHREGCVEREQHMARRVRAAKKQHSRILVVTGGFHTAALRALVEGPEEPGKESKIPGESNAYLIPYSFAESDQLAGYASGMPYPAFYQEAHERIAKDPGTAYDDAVLQFVARIGGALRRKKEGTSIADEVAAAAQSRGLAALRDKEQQGVYELLDAVRSAYVKGDVNLSTATALRTAAELLRGDKMGKVTSGAELVPLLRDFRDSAARLRLKSGTTVRQEVTLDILSKPAHRACSVFLHQLEFLEVGFGELRAGPSYRDRDTSRVRERWTYAFGAKVEARVVDVSYLGGTVREAASTALSRKRKDHAGCGEHTRLLIDAAVMDLTEHVAPLLRGLRDSVAEDGSFASLTEAVGNLLFLENARWLLGLEDLTFVRELLVAVYYKAAALLPTLETGQEDEDRALAKSLSDLYGVAGREDVDETVLQEALQDLVGRHTPQPPPSLQGAAAGLLYAWGRMDREEVLELARGYLFGTGEQVRRSGRFLGGLLLTAWDILFQNRGFLEGLGAVLETLPSDEFLALLPDMRLAFSVFTPGQLDRLGRIVAEMLGVSELDLRTPAAPERLLALGRELDDYAAVVLKRKGATA